METSLNYTNVLASMIVKKHHITVDAINKQLKKNYVDVDVRDIKLDEMHLYDRFMVTAQREKTGSYYTPYALAETMVHMSFYDYFSDTDFDSDFFLKPYDMNNELLYNKLKSMKIVDIACGTGVFLLACLRVLSNYYHCLGKPVSMNMIVSQLEGYDIQDTPLEILDLLVLDIELSHHENFRPIKTTCLDTILHTFDTTYDMVIGNPPYVGEKGNKALFDQYKAVQGYEGRMDLFYFFVYKGYDILNPDGLLHFITTNYFVTADGAKGLRAFLKTTMSLKRMINLDECKMFSDAKGMHNMIFSLSKKPVEKTKVLILDEEKINDLSRLYDVNYSITSQQLFSETGNIVLYENTAYYSIIQKMVIKGLQTLNQLVDINQGIVTGADKVTKSIIEKKLSKEHIKINNIAYHDPIYVFEDKPFESRWFKPFYKNSQITPYHLELKENRWLLYVNQNTLTEEDEVYQHLLPFKPLLEQRREVKSGARKWYELQWGRKESIFTGPKIVVPQRANKNVFGYTEEAFYSSADVYYLTNGPLKYLLGILNSKLYYFWLYNRGKRKGKYLELYAKPLSQIPIPIMTDDFVVRCVDEILNGDNRKAAIDHWLYRYYHLDENEINLVETLYSRG